MTTVRLPWPPAKSSPNGSQGDWRGKADAGRAYKDACWGACKEQRVQRMDVDAVDVTITFCPPTARAYDLDNALAKFKRGGDAFATAIGVDDARWSSMTLERGLPMRGGAVFVTATPCGVDGFLGGSPARPLKGRARDGSKRSSGPGATNTQTRLNMTNLNKRSDDV